MHEIEYLDPARTFDEPVDPAAPSAAPVARRPLADRLRWVVAFGALATFVTGAVAVAVHEPPLDAGRALAAAQHVVDGVDAYRVELRQTLRMSSGGAGSDGETTFRTTGSGFTTGPDHWQVTQDIPAVDAGFEMRQVGDTLYSKVTGAAAEAGPPWIATTVEDGPSQDELVHEVADALREASQDDDDPEALLPLTYAAYVLPSNGDPHNVSRLVLDATDPTVEERLPGGGVRLRAEVAPLAELAKAVDPPLQPLAVTMDLDDEDRPVAIRFEIEVGDASDAIELAFSDWGADLRVDAPPADQIDQTPWIEEEALADLDPSLLRAPTVLPEGWDLVTATVYDDWSDGDDDCRSLDLTYDTKADHDELAAISDGDAYDDALDDQPALDVTISPPDCGYAEEGFDVPFAGYQSDGLDDGVIDIAVDGVVVAINSDQIDRADLVGLVRSLQPTTVDALVAAIPTWAHDDVFGYWESGSGSSGFDSSGSIAEI